VPIKPAYLGRAAGPMTRTVADAALLMQTLSRPDWRDATSLPPQDIAWTDLTIDLSGLKIGLLLDAGWGLPLDDDIRSAVQHAAGLFEKAGATVEPLPAFTTREMADGINLFWRMRSWLEISALSPPQQQQVLPYIRAWVEEGSRFSAAQVFHGYHQFAALRDAAVAASQPFDFVISPVAPVSAFSAESPSPTGDPLRAMEHIGYTLPYNMSEQPAVSVPCAHTAAGLPIGLQIIGRRHDDLGVLRLAHAWEQLRPALRAWPHPPD
jgi:aspartyl-tRNA(Asn)/glutamyl-tRNA(Gln) amidotransferase subunit A